jgi:hypothetical protein
MSTSPLITQFKPTGSNKISRGTLGYICARARQWAYNLLIVEFKKSGVSQADFGRRLNRSPEVISRMLNRPGNWELDTFSAAVFALTGGILTFAVRYPAQNAMKISPEAKLIPTLTLKASKVEMPPPGVFQITAKAA